MKIVVDRDIPFLEGVLEPFAEVVRLPGVAIGPGDVRDADALLVRTRTRCDAALLESSRVRFVGTATIGFDHIDTAWCASRDITVATAAGSNRRGVLQWVGAALGWLVECGNHPVGRSATATPPREGNQLRTPQGLTLGVVGVGNVGSLVAEYAAAWGFRVMLSDPPRERAEGLGRAEGFYPLGEIAAGCDIITFHVPLTTAGPDATHHMVSPAFMAATRPGATILNSSRGPIVDPAVLRSEFPSRGGVAAKGGRGGFIIDTWNNEPAIDPRALQRTLLATPHIAGYTAQGKAAASAMMVQSLARRFGLPLTEWYPAGAPRSHPRPIGWEEMRALMPSHFDISAQSAALKAAPERFEAMRDGYNYRTEFF